MELPSTREEFVIWKLEYSDQSFMQTYIFDIKIDLNKLEKWIRDTYENFPDLVEHKKTSNDVHIMFAGVQVMTLKSSRLYEMDLLSSVVRHHYYKYGEFL